MMSNKPLKRGLFRNNVNNFLFTSVRQKIREKDQVQDNLFSVNVKSSCFPTLVYLSVKFHLF